MKKHLSEIITGSVTQIHGSADSTVTGFSSDSRQIASGNMFFAVKGEQTDGNKHIDSAVKNGASVVVSENNWTGYCPVTYLQVTDIFAYMAESSALFYDTNSPPIKMIGVTGTNGKTTTAHFINEVLKSLSIRTVFVGTIGIEICGELFHTDYTTPPAFEIHRLIRKGLDLGAEYFVMEVSSHALKFKRILNLKFDAAVFTNLTHEHREIHPTMDDYFQTKQRLFRMLKSDGFGMVNADDPYGKKILSGLSNLKLRDYGYDAQSIKIVDLKTDRTSGRQTISYESDGKTYRFDIPMPGSYNAYNALAAVATLSGMGFHRTEVHACFQSLPPVPGRMEWYEIDDFYAVIDFAHTPDGIEKLIQAVRSIRQDNGRVITIFGCPGSRDPSKRPLMGKIASDLSDYVIVTTDDIHHEEPDKIIAEIVKGILKSNFESITDRREAIARGLTMAKKGDYLIIAGRGHEKFQYVENLKVPFLDKNVLFEEAERLGFKIGNKKS